MSTATLSPAQVSSSENIKTSSIPTAILAVPTPSALRAELEQTVINDLLGPAGGPEEEVDESHVSDRYLVGMLAPRQQRLDPEQFDELAAGGDDTTEDGPVDVTTPQAGTLFPSSFGMTFCVLDHTTALKVTARWGRYTRERSHTLVNDKTDTPRLVWKRKPVEDTSQPISLCEGPITPWVVTPEQPDVTVQGHLRQNGNNWIVTLFLVNGQEEPKQLRDAAWIFQPELIVEAPDGSPIFCRHMPHHLDPVKYPEEHAMAMLYRRHVEFAVGHGVAVHADVAPGRPEQAVRIATRVVPTYEIPKQTPPTIIDNPALAGLVLDMKELSETADADFTAKLTILTDAYAAWMIREQQKITTPTEELGEYVAAANNALANCARALTRIREGITLLGSNPQAAEAFRFANRAMWKQRTHTLYALEARRGRTPDMAQIDTPQNRSWFPFQLAFLLLNLPSLTDLRHADRSAESTAVADLLWFPTGGGKTEAYLGLTAYTLGLRRLQGTVAGRSGEHGVAVLMRYTLRLLTLQQFQRAATLICACESIRREALMQGDVKWGSTPFRIGLWVGQRTTPNWTEQSAESVKQDHGNYQQGSVIAGSGSPAQLTNCPWCGTAIDRGKHIKVETFAKGQGRTLVYCGDPLGRCLFSERQSSGEGLPVVVVDEEIYRRLPALLIATVDKFAQMPWNGATQMLFGQVDSLCPRHGFRSPEIKDSNSHPKRPNLPAVQSRDHAPLRPPDLIIQDELHLISGPLGTLVGLYETAVDALASWEVEGHRVRPKVIASTATIRRARDQINALFLRRVEIFPPQGTDIRDNFFSLQREPSEDDPGRRYIGICASGKRLKVALIRVYFAFLTSAQQLYEKYGAAADPWMTLVGYFNAMRELGGMRRLVDDDIRSRLRDAAQRGLAKRKPPVVEELTSRKGSSDIPFVLDRLEAGFDPVEEAQRQALRKAGRNVTTPEPLDVLLATNMVSVGVDVRRLGLMVVAGQPKTTAEYIQATSRVGRSTPGLVCTVYNWARPRDLSHYERFEHYHATFYQHVEALSVTPFAPRALDRGLSALLVALVRLAGGEFNENARAEAIESNHPYVQRAIDTIVQRAKQVVGMNQVGDDVHALLQRRLDLWLAQARRPAGGSRLGYRDKRDQVTKGLLQKPSVGQWEPFTCLNSLREVEPSVGLVLDDHSLDDEGITGTDSLLATAPAPQGETS